MEFLVRQIESDDFVTVGGDARSLEGAIPSSRAIWLSGATPLASSPTASRLNSSVN
jgi:hypothetical protein